MSIWNKILIGFIAVAAIAFFYLGARTLKTHAHWRTAIAAHEKALGKEHPLEPEGLAKVEADLKQSVRQLKLDLHRLYLNRPRIWSDVKDLSKPELVKDDKGRDLLQVTVTVDSTAQPLSEQEFKDFNLWLFEKRDAEPGGRYLGEFLVTAVAGKQVQLRPAKALMDWQVERLRGSLGPWIIYEHLPVDEYDAFDGVPDISKLVPAASLAEYQQRIEYSKGLKDGAKAKAAAAKDEAAGDKEDGRPKLRDYAVSFGRFFDWRAAFSDTMEALKRDAAAIKKDLELVTSEVALRDKEIASLNEELTVETRKRDVMAAHLKAVQAKLADISAKVVELIKSNRSLAAAIARIQQESTRRIDAQTRKMANTTGSP